MDDLELLRRRIYDLEMQVTELHDKSIAESVFSDGPDAINDAQRIFGGSGTGAAATPRPFDLRITWRETVDDDGNPVSVQMIDVYRPSVEYVLYNDYSETSGIVYTSTLANGVVDLGDGWYQLCRADEWTALSSSQAPIVVIDVTGLEADVTGALNRSYVLRLGTRLGGDVWLTPGLTSEVPENPVMFTLATLYLSDSTVTQNLHGNLLIQPSRTDAGQHLYVKNEEGQLIPVESYTGTFDQETLFYIVTLMRTTYRFFDCDVIDGKTLIPVGQTDGGQHFSSTIKCRMHSADHYDNFIPEVEQ